MDSLTSTFQTEANFLCGKKDIEDRNKDPDRTPITGGEQSKRKITGGLPGTISILSSVKK